jgi:L-arginine dehydrogenase
VSRTVPILDDARVLALLDELDIAAALRAMFLSLHVGRSVQPPQTLTFFPADAGDFITYAGVMADAAVFGVKVSPCIVQDPRPRVTAWTLLMSAETGEPLLLCNSKRLTTERTAATTALAVDLLAPADARHLAIVGTGDVAEAHLRHILPLRRWERVRVTSRGAAAAPPLAYTRLTGRDARVRMCAGVDEAVADADVVLLCTSSGVAVLDPAQLTKPALITSVSTNAVRAHEIPPASLASMDVYCDYRRTAPLSAGEMVIAQADHGWSPESIVGDLPELVAGVITRRAQDRHVFFRSIGLGLEDIAIAAAVHAVFESHAGEGQA